MKKTIQLLSTLFMFIITYGVFLLPDYIKYEKKGTESIHTIFFSISGYLAIILLFLGYCYAIYNITGKIYDKIKN